MTGTREQVDGFAGLRDAARVHHRDAMADLRHDTEIVRDQDHRKMQALLQLGNQFENLRLHRHVEGGGRFVGDQQFRFAGQCHRDHHALAHAAGEFMRMLAQAPARRTDVDQCEQLLGAAPCLDRWHL